MAKLIVFILIGLAINCKLVTAIALYCQFEMIPYSVGLTYTCSATVLFNEENSEDVTAIFGIHLPGKVNEDVGLLIIQSQNLQFFPQKIAEFLPNLGTISFYNNSIPSVRNEDLSPFPNLFALDLTKNRISVLDKNLFHGLNPSFRDIILGENDITSIDSNLFAGLIAGAYIDLSYNKIRHFGHDFVVPERSNIWLMKNTCIDTSLYAYDDKTVSKFKFDLLINCPPTISLIESTLESRQNFIQNMMDRIAALERIIESGWCASNANR